MDDGILTSLKTRIAKLKGEREEYLNAFLKERQIVTDLELEMNKLRAEFEHTQYSIKEKEEVIANYNKMIANSERAYSMVQPNAFSLSPKVRRKFLEAPHRPRKRSRHTEGESKGASKALINIQRN
eukprot:TRINITY_DN5252_c0_g2_i4.p1 TRINITY_DN5252_c0_g2~~TRINITY_DN5252_c0_g2_i4.p1  ORF type:complete len:126 (+),score=34.03 TRINITY_DN5252_c0_g2_i4:44-421(+)